MKFAKKYVRATDSSDLKNDLYHHDCDALGAMAHGDARNIALGGPGLGGVLFRAKYGSDGYSVSVLLEQWTIVVLKKAEKRQWPTNIKPERVAELSLIYWLKDQCQACNGRAFEPLELNPRVLSDKPCPRCKGTGVNEIRCNRALIDYVTDMVGELNDMASTAAGRAMAKIGRDMDLT